MTKTFIHIMAKQFVYLLMFLTGIVLAACSGSEDEGEPVVDPQEKQYPIAMSAFSAEGMKERALITGLSDLQKLNEGFAVYGFKTNGTTNTPIFYHQQVFWNSTNAAWEYSPIKFWDTKANQYSFAAYAPAKLSYTGAGADSHTTFSGEKLILRDFKNWMAIGVCDESKFDATKTDPNHCEKRRDGETDFFDVMVATSYDTPANYLNSPNNGFVKLEFSHLQAMIVVNVAFQNLDVGTETTNTYYVTDVLMDAEQIPAAGENWRYAYDVEGVGNYYRETATGTEPVPYGNAGRFSFFTSSGDAKDSYPVEAIKNPHLIKRGLVVPFETKDRNDLRFQVRYFSNGRNLKGDEKVPDATGTVETGWLSIKGLTKIEAGKIYTFTIQFDKGMPLNLIDVYVSDWKEHSEPITQNFYNW